jgi:hypothetical protein
MTWDVRPCASRADLLEAIRPISHYFGYTPTEDNVERASRVMPLERMHAAWDGDRAVGGAGSSQSPPSKESQCRRRPASC